MLIFNFFIKKQIKIIWTGSKAREYLGKIKNTEKRQILNK
tara:strand:- start:36 stop:155 length:120 start_codon:yes stop_codon:yes gene_type:complete